ncbi:MAG: dihydrolipoamide dehydrogenase [Verrucomicrobiales bacterium]|nr:dihydrolipoamide dehydrogenase [Verrucomicrobiales bacterium]
MERKSFDLVVIGAGPGGYVAAIRAAQLGLKVACVEKEAALGGTCLRIGCIPSKALLESSELFHQAKHNFAQHGISVGEPKLELATLLKRKDQVVQTLTGGIDFLFKKNKVTRIKGTAAFISKNILKIEGADAGEIEGKNIIIATGSKATVLPGIELDGTNIGTSTEALAYSTVPRHLVVIGAGYIGLELGSVWLRLGSKVTVVEFLDRILPGMDQEIATMAQKIFEKQGFVFKLGHKVKAVKHAGGECVVECEGVDPIKADKVLVAVGRAPNTDGLGLDKIGIKLDSRKRIEVNHRFETTVKNVFAIGDVIAGPMLAHKAEEEGIACVEFIAGKQGHVDYNSIPGVAYTHPEIASVGKTEEQLVAEKVSFKKGVFPFKANGRAQALADTEGKVKILADAETDRILGVHIIGPRAGDLIAEAAIAIAFKASSEDIAISSHAHPTLAEAFKEAAMAVHNRAIHS